ncbi:hypothetical protein N7G274_009153 [Stereocaulon virgatum]|uniref:Uncharacterized protein n=1 Tax=Stereocaulon virgatum TaxID=373712 RepID=A0ABR3ZZG6_9LECA
MIGNEMRTSHPYTRFDGPQNSSNDDGRFRHRETFSSTLSLRKLDRAYNGEPSQTRTPLVWQASEWLVTNVICELILITIMIYELKGNVTKVQKYVFNTLIAGLASLNLLFYSSFLMPNMRYTTLIS